MPENELKKLYKQYSVRNKAGDDDEDSSIETEGLIQEKIKTSKEYIIYFDDVIEMPDNYRNICKTLRDAKKEDTIRIVMSSNGGYIRTFIQIYNYLLDCKAKTICEFHTGYSAGSLIALSCDEIEVKRFAGMMIHDMSFGSSGKRQEIKDHVDYADKRWKSIIKQLYKNFLTEEEIKSVLKGKDIWLQEKDIKRRLKRWTPIRKREDGNSK